MITSRDFFIKTIRKAFVICAVSCLPLFSVMAATGDGCDNENADYISPTLALCSTHAYNIGQTTNPKTDAERQAMRDVVALKTTVMTQQMYKQYEYLESMIKRFKTQLEKAVLTTKLTVAGATDGGNSSYNGIATSDSLFKSSDRYVVIDGAKNCNNETTGKLAVYECLNNNISVVLNALNENKNTEAKKQLEKDIEVANLWGVTNIKNCNSRSTPNEIRNCAYGMRVALSTATDNFNNDKNRNFQQNMPNTSR